MLWLYPVLSTCLLPVVWGWLQWRKHKGKEHPARIGERFGAASRARPQGGVVWVHAASVGEFNAALPLIEALKNTYPVVNILITTGTVTSAALAEKYTGGAVIHQFAPIDTWPTVARFLRHWQPDMALWMESELWPAMVLQTHARRIPMALVNARMSERSAQHWHKHHRLFMQMINSFSAIYAASHTDAQRYKDLGANQVTECHSIKYDASAPAIETTFLEALHRLIAGRPCWVAASTHPGEEEQLLAAQAMIRQQISEAVLLLVPRHPHRADDIALLCEQQKKHAIRCSSTNTAGQTSPAPEIIIGDVMGQMGSFFRCAPVVTMGGSFVPIGGHNPIEPAIMGCAVLCGPHMFHFADMTQAWKAEGALVQVENAAGLAQVVIGLLQDEAQCRKVAQQAKAAVEKRKGMVNLIMQQIAPWLQASAQRQSA